MVTLKVGFRTHSHTQGLLAIVYETKESTGGILFCCEHGIITHDGSRKDYWFPMTSMTLKQGHRTHAQLKRLFGQYATWFWKVGTTQQINKEYHIQSNMRKRLDQ